MKEQCKLPVALLLLFEINVSRKSSHASIAIPSRTLNNTTFFSLFHINTLIFETSISGKRKNWWNVSSLKKDTNNEFVLTFQSYSLTAHNTCDKPFRGWFTSQKGEFKIPFKSDYFNVLEMISYLSSFM